MARIVPNLKGIAELSQDPAVLDDLERRMQRVEQEAKSSAPVATGAYQASIHTERDADGVRVVADVPYALFVEADTGNLSRSLDAAGGE